MFIKAVNVDRGSIPSDMFLFHNQILWFDQLFDSSRRDELNEYHITDFILGILKLLKNSFITHVSTPSPPNTTIVPYAYSLDADETPSNSAPHPDPSCSTPRQQFRQLWATLKHFENWSRREIKQTSILLGGLRVKLVVANCMTISRGAFIPGRWMCL